MTTSAATSAADASGAQPQWPGEKWATATESEACVGSKFLDQARDYALKGEGAGMIVRGGKVVLAWGDTKQRYDIKSSTKSFGAAALGLAISDGKVSLADKAVIHQPDLAKTPAGDDDWPGQVTLLHLATHTGGFEKAGGYSKLAHRPGTRWLYSDCGPNWLAECLSLAYKRDLSEVMIERIFTPLGITSEDLVWRRNQYRPEKIGNLARRELGAGIHANVDAMARFLSDTMDAASNHYGLLWWNNSDGSLADVPKDAYWSWGLYDSFIIVIPSLDLVIARAGKSLPDAKPQYERLKPFLTPIVKACGQASEKARATAPAEVTNTPQPAAAKASAAPYPPSPVIRSIKWAPPESIVRKADDCDNWPLTWADDGHQYTAYGDGYGFEPKVERKLSLGLCRIEGGPDDFRGFNVRSDSGEQIGDGRRGKKASGILCIDGVLYMFVRNAGNSQLTVSLDHGKNWQWCDWKFTASLGCPTLLNFGKDYAGARDGYVYVYSFDSETAYEPGDRMVLARVPKDKLARREAYEFFVRLDEAGEGVWSTDIRDRGAVFEHKGRCYRSGVTYNAAIKRYMWVQIIPGGDTRFKGGLGIYDAPEPWGPWTTVYFTELWDVGPGECASLPTKWMSDDGSTVHMVSSGDDHFSVRKAAFELAVSASAPKPAADDSEK
jgi:CubicO group peptidase (beta-lactamase class C family)